MFRTINGYIIDFTGILAIGVFVCLAAIGESLAENLPFEVSSSIVQLNTIFISVLIEALPFVLIGVFIAGFIQIFVTEDHLRALMPKNRFSAVFVSCLLGACFPACECGIVPIVRGLSPKAYRFMPGSAFC